MLQPHGYASLIQTFLSIYFARVDCLLLTKDSVRITSSQHDQEQKKPKNRALNVTENLVRIALTVAKVKAVAQHYETLICCYASL